MTLGKAFGAIALFSTFAVGTSFAQVSFIDAFNQESQFLRDQSKLFTETLQPYCDISVNLKVGIRTAPFYEEFKDLNEVQSKFYLEQRSNYLKHILGAILPLLQSGLKSLRNGHVTFTTPGSKIQRIEIEPDDFLYSSYADLDEDGTVLKIRLPKFKYLGRERDIWVDLPRDLDDEFGVEGGKAFTWPPNPSSPRNGLFGGFGA